MRGRSLAPTPLYFQSGGRTPNISHLQAFAATETLALQATPTGRKNGFASNLHSANMMQKYVMLQSKPVENAVNAIFASIFAYHCKYGKKYGIYGVCYRFALEQTCFCIIFALRKFHVNPFSRPVSSLSEKVCC